MALYAARSCARQAASGHRGWRYHEQVVPCASAWSSRQTSGRFASSSSISAASEGDGTVQQAVTTKGELAERVGGKQTKSMLQAVQLQANDPTHGVLLALHRQQACIEFGLQLRDLRIVDPEFRNQLPVILVRTNALLVNMDDVRAIIGHNRILFFDFKRTGVKKLVERLKAQLVRENAEGIEEGDIPFELKALECTMQHVCESVEDRYARLAKRVEVALKQTRGSGQPSSPGDSLEALFPVKRSLRSSGMEAKEISEAVQELLANDEDLDGLFLKDNWTAGGSRKEGNHEEAEIMLENYLKRVEQVRNDIAELRDEIAESDEHVRMALDRSRNAILKMSLIYNIGGMSLTSAMVIPALFGMNLIHFHEDNPLAFHLATLGSMGTMSAILITSLWIIKKYKV